MRQYLSISMHGVHLDDGWWAFAYVGRYIARFGLEVDQLAYRAHREEFGGITTHFEVLKTP